MCNFKATFDLWTMELRAGTEGKGEKEGRGGGEEGSAADFSRSYDDFGACHIPQTARNVQRKFIFAKRN